MSKEELKVVIGKEVKAVFGRSIGGGCGIVNFDGAGDRSGQRNLYQEETGIPATKFATIGKKQYFRKADGSLESRMCVSNDCLWARIFYDGDGIKMPNNAYNDETFVKYVANLVLTTRGFTSVRKDASGLTKKSPLMISSWVQIPDDNGELAIPTIQTNTRSGFKGRHQREDSNSESEEIEMKDVKDDTLFARETVGNVKYQGVFALDVSDNLRFLSMDERCGRMAFNPDYWPIYKEAFLKNTGIELQDEPQYYRRKGQSTIVGEYGYVFDDAIIIETVKMILNQLLGLFYQTSHGFIETQKVQIKLVYDPRTDKMTDENGWIDVTPEMIDNLSFIPANAYVPIPVEEAEAGNADLDEHIAVVRNRRASKTTAKDVKKKSPAKKATTGKVRQKK